jgi:hypothetical protein
MIPIRPRGTPRITTGYAAASFRKASRRAQATSDPPRRISNHDAHLLKFQFNGCIG